MALRTYIDANVLINALEGKTSAVVQVALDVLTDSDRILLASDFLRLEVLPKRLWNQLEEQVEFINAVLAEAEIVPLDKLVTDKAWTLACEYGLGPVDALHIASAIRGQAHEMVSFEKPSKPMYKIPSSELIIRSLHPLAIMP